MFESILTSVQRRHAEIRGDSIIFQLEEITYNTGTTRNSLWEVPIIRIFGNTEYGESVFLRVHDFEPYFYADLHTNTAHPLASASKECLDFLNEEAARQNKRQYDELRAPSAKKQHFDEETPSDIIKKRGPFVVHVESVNRRRLRGGLSYADSQMLKITTRLPKFVPLVRGILEAMAPPIHTYEADVLFPLRFMIDKQICGCDWLSVKVSPPQPDVRIKLHRSDIIQQELCNSDSNNDSDSSDDSDGEGLDFSRMPWSSRMRRRAEKRKFKKVAADVDNISRCGIEIDAPHAEIVCLGHEGNWSKHAPMRILSFDIECISDSGDFPDSAKDPVITICSRLSDTATPGRKYDYAVALQFGECLPVKKEGVQTVSCKSEEDLILKWRDFVVQSDPDILLGYNISKFDIGYLVGRARALNINKKFLDIGRIRGELMTHREGGATTSNRACGTLDSDQIIIGGRIPYDLMLVIKILGHTIKEYKFPSYSLNYVASAITGEHKIDLDHRKLPGLFKGTPDDRRIIATYCDQDTVLPLNIIDKKLMIRSDVEMCRASCIPMSYLYGRGQSVRVYSQLDRLTKQRNYVIETASHIVDDDSNEVDPRTYEGATVIEPTRGFHNLPVATLDFASLYPSIMRGHNLCYTTLLTADEVSTLLPDQYFISPAGHYFVKAPVMFKESDLVEIAKSFESSGDRPVKNVDYVINPSGSAYFVAERTIRREIAEKMGLKDQIDFKSRSPEDNKYVIIDSAKRCGILPDLLSGLIAARSRAKAAIKVEKDEEKRAVYDCRQLQLKICANSVYGATGATFGKLGQKEIAESVTSWGRKFIDITKNLVEERYSKAKGHFRNAKVLYGDTDSVMVDFGIRAPVGPVLLDAIKPALSKLVLPSVTRKSVDEFAKMAAEKFFPPEKWKRETDEEKSDPSDIFQESRKHLLWASEMFLSYMGEDVDRKKYGTAESLTDDLLLQAVDMYQVMQSATFGKDASKLVTQTIGIWSMSIEFEKVYMPVIMAIKKRYAGVKFMANPNTGVIECVGIEVHGLEGVRRDNCGLTKDAMATFQNDILIKRDPILAVQHIRDLVNSLLTRKFSMEKFVITKGLSKKRLRYVTPQPHQALVERVAKRRAVMGKNYQGTSEEYHLGDRVPYVIVAKDKKAKTSEKSEDPLFVAIHNVPLDMTYYLKKMIRKPMKRMFRLVVADPTKVKQVFDPSVPVRDALSGQASSKIDSNSSSSSVLERDTMIHKSLGPVSTAPGTLGRFVVSCGAPCLHCNALVAASAPGQCSPALCGRSAASGCMAVPGLFDKLRDQTAQDLEECRKRLQEILQTCAKCESIVGSSTEMCGNSECAVLYNRIKASADIEECTKKLSRFSVR